MNRTPIWLRFFLAAGFVVFVSLMAMYASIAAELDLRDTFYWMAVITMPLVGLLMTAGFVLLIINRINERDVQKIGKSPQRND